MECTETIKYIDNDIQKGIEINWKRVQRECKALGVPDDVYTPFSHNFYSAKYFVECSERSIGKTTNWLLLGMILNKMYGIQIIYIRQIIDMIMPRNLKLFHTILENGYVEKITDGEYNSVKYFSRGFYYINTVEKTEASEPFCICMSIDNNLEYKSSFNAPRGDLIIFDEFIGKHTSPDEFCQFEDLVKTIIRERESPIVVLLANTIDRYHVYFKELEIYDYVQIMQNGEQRLVTTDMGTHININLIANKRNVQRKEKHNSLFFGFKNKKLNAIRGGEWATNSYPHIPKCEYREEIRNRYVDFNGKLIKLDIVYTELVGLAVFVHDATQTYDDSVIYTSEDIKDKNHRYLLGHSKIDKLIWTLYAQNKFYYAHNMLGEMINSYVKDCKMLRR